MKKLLNSILFLSIAFSALGQTQPRANQIRNTPAGGISATNVQDALNELDTEKANLASPTFTGTPTLPTGTTGVTQSVGNSTTALATTAFVSANAAKAFVETGIVYVDPAGSNSTGTLGRADLPFQTIDAALDAGVAVTYLHVKLSMGTFAMPTPAKLRANLWLEGSGKPGYNWVTNQSTSSGTIVITDPTALIGGTIIQGGLEYTLPTNGNVWITNLGVDRGSAYVTGGGTEGDGIYIVGFGPPAPFNLTPNVVIQNVTTLGRTAASAFHGIVLVGLYQPFVDNVDTYFATHGIAVKCMRPMITNTRHHNHTLDGIIIKADAISSACQSGIVSNFQIFGGGGLIIQSATSSLAGVGQFIVSDGNIKGTTFGVLVDGTGAVNANTKIDNVGVYNIAGIGFDIQVATQFNITNCSAFLCTGDGFFLRTSNAQVLNIVQNCWSAGNGGDAFDVAGGTTGLVFLQNCNATSNTGQGFAFGVGVQSDGIVSHLNGGVKTGESTKIGLESRTSFNRTGAAAPTGTVYIQGGTTTANSAPLVIGEGTNMTTPQDGAIEHTSDNLHFSTGSTPARFTLAKTLTNTGTLDFGSTAAGAATDLTISLAGCVSGDIVVVGVTAASMPANGSFHGWCSSANVATVRFTNNDLTNAMDPASGTFRVSLIKY